MIAIVLAASTECEEKLRAAGFVEKKVFVRSHSVQSTKANKARIESEMFKLGPYQFLVSDYWGWGPE